MRCGYFAICISLSLTLGVNAYQTIDKDQYIPTDQDYEELVLEELYSSLLDDKVYNKLQQDYQEPNDDIYSLQPVEENQSHDSLPFYCPPPNPCPKGLTAADGCDEQIKDTEGVQKGWINDLMENGYCGCDQEHMFSCSKKASDDGGIGDMLDRVMLSNSKVNLEMDDLSKLDKLPIVAKKSPRFKRSANVNSKRTQLKRDNPVPNPNPYLMGANIGIVAKKGVIFH